MYPAERPGCQQFRPVSVCQQRIPSIDNVFKTGSFCIHDGLTLLLGGETDLKHDDKVIRTPHFCVCSKSLALMSLAGSQIHGGWAFQRCKMVPGAGQKTLSSTELAFWMCSTQKLVSRHRS